MLLFTPEQARAVLANRRAFNIQQAALSERFGLQNNQDAGLVGNALPMPRDVWGEWDREAVQIQREVLQVFDDLSSAVSRSIPIGKLAHYFQRVSDSGEVNISMDGRSKADRDQPVVDYQGTPVPIFDSTFGFGWRQMEAASTEGYNLDATARINADHKVATAQEDFALYGSDKIVVGGARAYGLLNHPKRNTRATGQPLNGATGPQWVADVTATLKLLHAANFRVPVTLYMNWDDWFYAGNTDYSTQYPNKTIAQRVMEIEGVERVVPASRIPANTISAVVRSRRVVEVLSAMPQTTRAQFRANPEDDYDFVCMAASATEIKFDYEDNCGIAHSSI